MNRTTGTFRLKMLLGTAIAGMCSIPGAAQPQSTSLNLDNTSDGVTISTPTMPSPGVQQTPDITVTGAGTASSTIDVLKAAVVAEWNSFSVPFGTSLTVNNASGSTGPASLLNRVIGGGISDMGGTVTTNDVNFWLINQNGILFGNNTSISGSSLFFSTLDVSNADFFNGSATTKFAGPSTKGITGGGAGAKFVSDGSLWFVSQNLDLTASFTSKNESVAFISASDVDVAFTPGSPLGITVNAGTTLARSIINGSVQGGFAAFHMVTAADIVGQLLINGTVSATAAEPTENGVMLFGDNQGTGAVSITANGEISSTGIVDVDADGKVTLAANATGSSVDIDAVGAVSTANLTATAGGVEVTSTNGAISTHDLSATGGNVEVTSATNAITTRDISSSLDVVLNAATTLTAGEVRADNDLTATSAGNLTLGSATANADNMGGGALDLDVTGADRLLRVTGASSGVTVDIDSAGSVSTGDVTATGGLLDIDAVRTITTRDLSATGGNVEVTSTTGSITTRDISSTLDVVLTAATTLTAGNVRADNDLTATSAGNLTLGSATANADSMGGGALDLNVTGADRLLRVTGASSGVTVDIDSAGSVSTGDVTATGGLLDIDAVRTITTRDLSATGGNVEVTSTTGSITARDISSTLDVVLTAATTLTAANVRADNDLTATAAGNLTLASATANADNMGGGALDLDVTGANRVLKVTGASSGVTVDIDSAGSVSTGDVTATGGLLDIDAVGGITTRDLSATGGNVEVTSTNGAITARDIASTLDVVLVTPGALTARDVRADNNLTATAGGNLTLASATANADNMGGGALDLDVTGADRLLRVTGASSGVTVDIDSAGSVSTGDVIATGGLLAIDAVRTITTRDLSATGGNVEVTSATGAITAHDITSTLDVVLTAATALTAGNVRADNNLTATAAGNLTLASATANADNMGGGALDLETTGAGRALKVTGASSGVTVDIDSAGSVSTGDVTATGGVLDIDAVDGITTRDLSATGGNVEVTSATGAITAHDITSTLDVVLTAATALTAGNVRADNNLTATAAGNLTLASATANADSMGGGAIDLEVTGAGRTLKVTGASSGVTVDIDSAGSVSTGDVTATGGVLDIDAVGGITTRDLSATGGNVEVTSTNGAITARDIASNLDVVLVTPGALTARDVRADNNLTATAGGNLTLASATANADNMGGGALDLDVTGADRLLRVTGASSGVTVDIDSAGSVSTGDVIATGGLLAIDAVRTITTRDLSATGGNVEVTSATGAITARDISSTLDVDLNANAALTARDVRAANDIVATAGGNLTLASAFANADNIGGGVLDLETTGANRLLKVTGASSGVTVDIDSAGSVSTGDVTATGGVLDIDAVGGITTRDLSATGGNVEVTSTSGAITARDIASTLNVVLVTPSTLTARDVRANNNLTATAGGNLTLASATANADNMGGGALDLETTGAGRALKVTGASSGVTVDIDSAGSISTGDVTATAGLLDIDAVGNITMRDLRATAGNVEVTSATGAITARNATSNLDVALNANRTITALDVSGRNVQIASTNGAISARDITSTVDLVLKAATTLTAGNVRANNNLTATSAGNLMLATAIANADNTGGGALDLEVTGADRLLRVTGASSGVTVDIDSAGSVITGDVTATSGLLDIDARRTITTRDLRATGGNVEVTSTTGAIAARDVASTLDVVLNAATTLTARNVRADDDLNAIAGDNLTLGGAIANADNLGGGALDLASTRGAVTLNGASSGQTVQIAAAGAININARVASNTQLATRSADMNIGATGSLIANEATLTVTGLDGGVRLGGTGPGSGFSLNADELNRIETNTLLLAAGARQITVSDVTFDAQFARTSAVFATTGNIAFVGNTGASGSGRLFQFGGTALGTGLADVITMNTDNAKLNFGDNTLELRATDIFFGRQDFLSAVHAHANAGRDSNFLTQEFVGNSASLLYNAERNTPFPTRGQNDDGTYLTAANLKVTYANAALFQNAGRVNAGVVNAIGLNVANTLTIEPTDDTNAFAVFGTIANLRDRAAALADPSIVVIVNNDDLEPFASRINGCQIRTGADCLSTVIGATQALLPSEQFDVFTAEDGALLPFDPLIGTNNEGLFSDVAPDCPTDDEGTCIIQPEGQR